MASLSAVDGAVIFPECENWIKFPNELLPSTVVEYST